MTRKIEIQSRYMRCALQHCWWMFRSEVVLYQIPIKTVSDMQKSYVIIYIIQWCYYKENFHKGSWRPWWLNFWSDICLKRHCRSLELMLRKKCKMAWRLILLPVIVTELWAGRFLEEKCIKYCLFLIMDILINFKIHVMFHIEL